METLHVMKITDFEKLAFSELRLVHVTNHFSRISNKRLLEAMTINEELRQLGYTLTPDGIRMLANSSHREVFLDRIQEMNGSVDAKPMYPDFPNQVMNMDEATFRLHQMLHYFSTYGIEWLTGEDIDKGWVPNVESTEKTESDKTLLNAKVIELVDSEEISKICYKRILSKRERLTDKEKQLIKLIMFRIPVPMLLDVEIPFKQNMLDVCNTIFDTDLKSEYKIKLFKNFCKHTGDVWKILDYILTRHKFHLKTSQKRMFVKLLDSYPVADFSENLVISNKKAERVKLMLKFLDYNTYSRNIYNKHLIRTFRNDGLPTWEGNAKRMINYNHPETLTVIAERPGIMLRWLTLLLRAGYSAKSITDALCQHADKLSTQTLVTLLTKFSTGNVNNTNDDEIDKVLFILRSALDKKFETIKTDFANKHVFIDNSMFELSKSELHSNDKSAEGGYVRSGIAYRIPENVNRLRFFTYWNDKKRVDIDLHAYALYQDGSICHIGWNADFRSHGLVTSGDLTHSDAAEYIDIDFGPDNPRPLKAVAVTIDLFNKYEIGNFKDIETCLVGMQAVEKLGEHVALYSPENCFFKHYLTTDTNSMTYGIIDIESRTVTFTGTPICNAVNLLKSFNTKPKREKFTIFDYLTSLLHGQNAEIVDSPERANVVLVMEKAVNKNEISLIDNNFFMDL